MDSYIELHDTAPQRELYVLHTDREELEIEELRWLGIIEQGLADSDAGRTSELRQVREKYGLGG